MNRRGFLARLGGAGVAVATAGRLGAQTPPVNTNPAGPLRVERADGTRFILGVAVGTVHAGDFVQIQTYGPATANILNGPVKVNIM